MASLTQIRVDYSELVEALTKGNDVQAGKLLKEIIPRLEEYLKVVMNAEKTAAEECAQQALVDVFDQIRKNNIKHNKSILAYLITACRHEYIRYSKKQHKFNYDEGTFGLMIEPERQIANLLDKERQRILEECLEELGEESREFIEYFMNKPYASTDEAVEIFNISKSNARTRKHRILGRLHDCYTRKSNE